MGFVRLCWSVSKDTWGKYLPKEASCAEEFACAQGNHGVGFRFKCPVNGPTGKNAGGRSTGNWVSKYSLVAGACDWICESSYKGDRRLGSLRLKMLTIEKGFLATHGVDCGEEEVCRELSVEGDGEILPRDKSFDILIVWRSRRHHNWKTIKKKSCSNCVVCYYLHFIRRERVVCGREAKYQATSSKAMLRSGVSPVTGGNYFPTIGWMPKVAAHSIGRNRQ